MKTNFCPLSLLKRARRKAAKAASKKLKYFNTGFLIILKTNKPGATPKVTTSASESRSLPIGLLTFNIRATVPSKKSNTVPKKIIILAYKIRPCSRKLMDKTPDSKFNIVMKLGKNLLSIIIILIFNVSYGQIANYSNDFLNIGVTARGIAMGNSIYSTASGASAVFYNPANMANLKNTLELAFTHSQYFNKSANLDYFSTAIKKQNLSLGFGFLRVGIDNIPNTLYLFSDGTFNVNNITYFSASDNAFFISLAQNSKKIKNLSYGAKIKLIYRHLGQFVNGYGFSIDLGITYKFSQYTVSGILRDITSGYTAWFYNLNDSIINILQQTGNSIPRNNVEITLPSAITAIARPFKISKKLSLNAEFSIITQWGLQSNYIINTKIFSLSPQLGLELNYKNLLFVRSGIYNFQRIKYFTDSLTFKTQLNAFVNLGIGLHYKNFSLDYAFQNLGNSAVALNSHFITLRIDLKSLRLKNH